MYAIIETGSKQYKVTPGQTIAVEQLNIAEGNQIELDKVLLVADGEKITVGKPSIKGAKVLATSIGNRKQKKIIVFKYKPKVRYRRKIGHRQSYTQLNINEIIIPKRK